MNLTFSGTLLRFVDYNKNVSFEACTVRDALAQVSEQYPKIRPVIYDGDGAIRAVHRISLNGELITEEEFDTELNDDDHVEILTAIAGG